MPGNSRNLTSKVAEMTVAGKEKKSHPKMYLADFGSKIETIFRLFQD